ncbi:MAG: ribosomal protein S18 acetylase RimI-like enzyme [Gammaproteobacteria bacterium]|jgi:ribosomal protein S18 acetylase RimI-like enzyme
MMNYRRYQASDHDKLVHLWQQVFPDDPAHNEPASLLEAKLAVDDLIFIAEKNNTIAGACMAGYDGHRGWLYAVAVDPEFRRQGLGRELVKQAITALKEIGCIKINLQIRSDNVEVAKFYQSLGFAVEDRMSMGVLLKHDG